MSFCNRNYHLYGDEEKVTLEASLADDLEADSLDAVELNMAIEEAFEGIETHILELSPAFVTQGGPQCVAIQYIVR